jgi:hypothetical protein
MSPAHLPNVDPRAFGARVLQFPEIAARVTELVELAEAAEGGICNADLAEERTTEILREVGKEVLMGWAARAGERATAAALDNSELRRRTQKKSTGTQRTAASS